MKFTRTVYRKALRRAQDREFHLAIGCLNGYASVDEVAAAQRRVDRIWNRYLLKFGRDYSATR